MRTVNFRDGVLHAVAYKAGLDPDQSNFLTNQAIPIGVSIDEWVRRTYDSKDWPEWTVTHQFVPVNHVVTWDAVAIDLVIPPSFAGTLVQLGRVLQVFLVDPVTTTAPVDTPFTLRDDGVHVGLEHGAHVWIKFMPPPPRYTAARWQAGQTYKKDDVVYSYTSGEVYRSKVNGNVNHDPATTFSPPPLPPIDQPPNQLPTEIVQELDQGNPGSPENSQITEMFLFTNNFPPDPPPSGAFFYAFIIESNVTEAVATTTADGTMTLADIVTDITNQLISAGGISGFTFTADTNALTVTAEKAGIFTFRGFYAPPVTGLPQSNFKTVQLQTYIPTISATNTTKQIIDFPLTVETTYPLGTYSLTFKDVSGGDHVVIYTATETDTADQVHAGLINAIEASSDEFFTGVVSTFDATSTKTSFASDSEIALHAEVTLPGSPWWEYVPFPKALADQVIRGAYADWLKEWGQADKGSGEEQVVSQEQSISEGKFTSTPNPALSGQERALSRYKI